MFSIMTFKRIRCWIYERFFPHGGKLLQRWMVLDHLSDLFSVVKRDTMGNMRVELIERMFFKLQNHFPKRPSDSHDEHSCILFGKHGIFKAHLTFPVTQ